MTANPPAERTRVLLVCTGNICRSPIAEALIRKELAARDVAHVEVASAGTGAWDGASASEGALLVSLEHGIDLSDHRARLLTREVVEGADLILTMGRHHWARVRELSGEGKTFVLGEYAERDGADAEVRDPFGGDLEMYRETFDELASLVPRVVDRLLA